MSTPRQQAARIAYTFDQGLAQIGKSRTEGYKAIASGELRTYLDGRRRMITHKALEEYVALKERQSQGRAA